MSKTSGATQEKRTVNLMQSSLLFASRNSIASNTVVVLNVPEDSNLLTAGYDTFTAYRPTAPASSSTDIFMDYNAYREKTRVIKQYSNEILKNFISVRNKDGSKAKAVLKSRIVVILNLLRIDTMFADSVYHKICDFIMNMKTSSFKHFKAKFVKIINDPNNLGCRMVSHYGGISDVFRLNNSYVVDGESMVRFLLDTTPLKPVVNDAYEESIESLFKDIKAQPRLASLIIDPPKDLATSYKVFKKFIEDLPLDQEEFNKKFILDISRVNRYGTTTGFFFSSVKTIALCKHILWSYVDEAHIMKMEID